jgi:hypothetical protein
MHWKPSDMIIGNWFFNIREGLTPKIYPEMMGFQAPHLKISLFP